MVTGFGFGQIINIPDANFKAKLIALGVDTNTDGEIQFTEALIPTIIDVSNSNISNLTGIEAFTNLINLICISNQISVLSISNLQNLEYLNCSQNNIMNLTLNNLFSLYYVNCSFNSITNLDFSSTTIKGVNCEFNSTLKTIILKNGIISSSIENEFGIAVTSLILGNCPLLNFICCDINEIQIWENLNSNATFNSYCSFIPGGNFNTITGTIKFDTNYDGCDNLDLIAKNVKININDGNNIGNTFTNNSGNYNFYVQQSNLTVTPILENPSYFNVSPAFSTVNFPSNNNLTEIRDFCITANGFNPDAEIVLVALDQPRPGFNCRYQIVLKNKGNNSFLQEAKFNFDESKMTYVSSSEPNYLKPQM